jgi:hypothetical protein
MTCIPHNITAPEGVDDVNAAVEFMDAAQC